MFFISIHFGGVGRGWTRVTWPAEIDACQDSEYGRWSGALGSGDQIPGLVVKSLDEILGPSFSSSLQQAMF